VRNGCLITGTTLIAVHTYHEVVIAADTKLRKVGNPEARDSGRAHRIGDVGNVFFAAAGLLGILKGNSISVALSLPPVTAILHS